MSRALLPAVAVLCVVSGAPGWAQMLPPADVPYSTGYGGSYPGDDDLAGPSYPVVPEPAYRRPLPPLYRPAEPPAAAAPYGSRAAIPDGQPSASRLGDDYRFARPSADPVYRPPGEVGAGAASAAGERFAALPPDYRPEQGQDGELAPRFRRQLVAYRTAEPAGTVIVDTAKTYLYYVLGNGQAVRYGIGVGRDGFTWSGRERISRMAEWPDWHPPSEMLGRQPDLPRFMAGGEGNPLGARALYLGKTLYRIHGTNQPSTIGTFVSSGCIRMLNADVEDLYQRVKVGTQVVVLAGRARAVSLPGAANR